MLLLPAILALMAVAAPAQAQSVNDTATANASTTIKRATSLQTATDMNFGTITQTSDQSGAITLSPSSAAECDGGPGIVHQGECSAASFTGKASQSAVFKVQGPAEGSVTLVGPDSEMNLGSFTYGAGEGLSQTGIDLFAVDSDTGDFTFFVGASLIVDADQPAGVYTGTFEVSIDYE
jgi:hypothetical protein